MKDIISSPEILGGISKKSLKARVAYKLARIIREIDNEFSLFQKSREQLISKYAEKDNEGKIIFNDEGNCVIEKDKIDLFNKEINELLETNVELNADYISLNDIENENFTIEQMNILSLFIEE